MRRNLEALSTTGLLAGHLGRTRRPRLPDVTRAVIWSASRGPRLHMALRKPPACSNVTFRVVLKSFLSLWSGCTHSMKFAVLAGVAARFTCLRDVQWSRGTHVRTRCRKGVCHAISHWSSNAVEIPIAMAPFWGGKVRPLAIGDLHGLNLLQWLGQDMIGTVVPVVGLRQYARSSRPPGEGKQIRQSLFPFPFTPSWGQE